LDEWLGPVPLARVLGFDGGSDVRGSDAGEAARERGVLADDPAAEIK
jgi:hypothetical protein